MIKLLNLFAVIVIAFALTSCGTGDSSAVQSFHSKIKPGMPLIEAIVEGEKAQHPDIRYHVIGRGSSEGDVEVGRYWQRPYIKVTEPAPDPKSPTASPYRELGYAGREDFARGVAEILPSFYDCKSFRFIFGRYQGGLRSDSFEVEIDEEGRITSAKKLSEDRSD